MIPLNPFGVWQPRGRDFSMGIFGLEDTLIQIWHWFRSVEAIFAIVPVDRFKAQTP